MLKFQQQQKSNENMRPTTKQNSQTGRNKKTRKKGNNE